MPGDTMKRAPAHTAFGCFSIALDLLMNKVNFCMPLVVPSSLPVTDRNSKCTVNTCMGVTTKSTRGSGVPGVVDRGAGRNLGTLELGSQRGPAS